MVFFCAKIRKRLKIYRVLKRIANFVLRLTNVCESDIFVNRCNISVTNKKNF